MLWSRLPQYFSISRLRNPLTPQLPVPGVPKELLVKVASDKARIRVNGNQIEANMDERSISPKRNASLQSAPPRLSRNLANILLDVAKKYPRSGVRTVSGQDVNDSAFLSYPALLEDARLILGGLRLRHLVAGSKIALLLERPSDFIPALWACVLGGYVPCPLAPIRNDQDRWAKHLSHVDNLLEAPLFICSEAQLLEFPVPVSSTDLLTLRRRDSCRDVHQAEPEDPAILVLTSGSTGNSKAVELTHGNVLASMAGRAERQQLTSDDITFNWIAFDHVAALLESHMIALYVGATQVHAEPAAILTDPLRFLRIIHHHRVSVAFAPNFLLGQINSRLQSLTATALDEHESAMDLSCLSRIVTGGEANVVETGRRFLELLQPQGLARSVLWPAFGMSETCAASVYSDEFPDRDVNREFASVGLPITGLEMRIVNEKGSSVPEGHVGELQVRGPVVFGRYYNNVEATRAAFSADGWFRTGDLGHIDEGRLSLVARSKDSIIVSGVNYFSQELEVRLEQLDGIARSFVAAFPTRPKGADTEQLVVTFATTIPPDEEEALYQLVVAVRNTTIMLWGFRPALIVPLSRDAFPKTSLGKIQRSQMRRRLEAGELVDHLIRMEQITTRQMGPYLPPEGTVESAITQIFSAILGIDVSALSTTASFFDLGGTSLDILKLTHALGKQFGLSATLAIVLQNPTVRTLAEYIAAKERHQTGKYNPLVPMQVSGRRTPVFCVHPGNGEVLVLINLAKYFLNDRPFYALRPRGFNEGEECFKSMEEIVSTYVDAIIQRQPRGPYALAGYSLGCRIVFEIAKVLEARGERVAFLGCIDWYPGCEGTGVYFSMPATLAYVLGLIDNQRWQELSALLYPTTTVSDPCEYVLRFSSPERLSQLDLDLRKFSIWSRVAYAMEDILFTHFTSGTVTAPMTVFCSDGMTPDYTAPESSRREWRTQLMRWDEFAPHTKYVDVPGQHQEVMFPKHVAAFQSIFRREIDRAFGET